MFERIKSVFSPKKPVMNSAEYYGKDFDRAIENGTVFRMGNTTWGLYNPMEGSGTARAFDSFNERNNVPNLTYTTLDQMFRSNWMAKRIVTLPARDITRKWREFSHADSDILRIREKAEAKLRIKQKVREAIQWADLYGGSAIVLGLNDSESASEPLDIRNIRKGDLKFINIVFKDQITPAGAIEIDPYSLHFQRPNHYFVAGSMGTTIHASRVIPFYGAELPLYAALRQTGWGDSQLIASYSIAEAAEKMWLNISQLISQSSIDVLKVNGYTKTVLQSPNAIFKLMQTQDGILSNYKKLIIDSNDDFMRAELSSFQGISEVLKHYLQMISGSAGIPLTKFLGISSGGFGEGDNEITEYYDMISERQNVINSQLDYLDRIIEMSTFGELKEIQFDWKSLREMDDLQKADLEMKNAQRDAIYIDKGVIDAAIVAKNLKRNDVYVGLEGSDGDEWIEALEANPPEMMPEDVNIMNPESKTNPVVELKKAEK